ncbi:MAG: MBL fold metallo-hydrolase [Thermaerobacter sp.]|nr:MBL fold metallo-hydrolase [Thermaerobacter sp.]
MRITWYGQSAFHLEDAEGSAFLDPFGVFQQGSRGSMKFDYPAVPRLQVDLLLITHEHFDHNAQEALEAPKAVVRSTAGRFSTPLGEVVGVASEHDPVAGTQRGPNSIFVFTLGGVRVCHFGDFGQAVLRPEQAAAIGQVDLLFVPVGGGPTIGADAAHAICRALSPRIIIPMHYRTDAINFLEPVDAFLSKSEQVVHLQSSFDTDSLPAGLAVTAVPAPPAA